MRDYTKLKAFELGDAIALEAYRIIAHFPKQEIYNLTSQIRRAGVSVPSNIIEGCAGESQLEYKKFLEIAFRSLKELHYQILFATRLSHIPGSNAEEFDVKLEESEKVLRAIIRSQRSVA